LKNIPIPSRIGIKYSAPLGLGFLLLAPTGRNHSWCGC